MFEETPGELIGSALRNHFKTPEQQVSGYKNTSSRQAGGAWAPFDHWWTDIVRKQAGDMHTSEDNSNNNVNNNNNYIAMPRRIASRRDVSHNNYIAMRQQCTTDDLDRR